MRLQQAAMGAMSVSWPVFLGKRGFCIAPGSSQGCKNSRHSCHHHVSHCTCIVCRPGDTDHSSRARPGTSWPSTCPPPATCLIPACLWSVQLSCCIAPAHARQHNHTSTQAAIALLQQAWERTARCATAAPYLCCSCRTLTLTYAAYGTAV